MLNNVSFIDEFSWNFNLKNMILTYTKDFSWKMGPNSIDFKRKKKFNCQIFIIKYIFLIFYFHIDYVAKFD
jgi:hypothetical protein